MSSVEFELNPSQKKAVEFERGPLLVVAGAGTGKTRVITQRIKYLLENRGVQPSEVLALTFTDKASGEMEARLGDSMPLGYEVPWIETFHSFCDRILKDEGLEIGLDTSSIIIPSSEQWLLFRKNLFKLNLKYYLPLGNPTRFVNAILKFISRLQDENITESDLLTFAKNFKSDGDAEEKEKWLELASAYKVYSEIKLKESKMDFGDLITWTIRLFKERPNVLKKYQTQFKHVLVDEFQDTNYSQYELIKLLCPVDMGDRSLLAVGDDSQSIYKFRGAAISNILEFRDDYPGVELVSLVDNYRSSQIILDSSYRLIQNNNPDSLESKLGLSKRLTSHVTFGDPIVKAVQLDHIDNEVEYVITTLLATLAKDPAYSYKDVAIMARANSHLDPFVLGLRKYGLPYQLVGNRGLYDRDEVKDVIALLKIIVNPLDTHVLYRALNIASFNISNEEITKLYAESKLRTKSLWESLTESENNEVKGFLSVINDFKANITKESPSQFIFTLLSQINYLKQYMEPETVENNLSIRNLDIFMTKVKAFEISYRKENREIPTIINFLDHLELLIEAGENPAQAEIEDIDTINLLTVHSSKGLEFPIVFMVNLVSDRFPTRSRTDEIEIPEDLIKETLPEGNAHIQEERRLFYVGMTRAQRFLYLVSSVSYGGKRAKKPSGFIEETGLPLEELADFKSELSETIVTKYGDVIAGFRDAAAKSIKAYDPKTMSYSQIEVYKTCPLKYKYCYVVNLPTAPNHVFSFGNTIHKTLYDFHNALVFEKDISLEDLYTLYDKHWEPLGYISEEHRLQRYEDGKNVLKDYYLKNKDLKINHVALEKEFRLKIDGITFTGKIDRVDKHDDGTIEIIDYKTGKYKDQKIIDKDDQVTYYAMGIKEALGIDAKHLTYYFLEEGKQVTTTRTEHDYSEKKKEIIEIVNAMREGKFEATPGYHCNYCPYNTFCPFAQTS